MILTDAMYPNENIALEATALQHPSQIKQLLWLALLVLHAVRAHNFSQIVPEDASATVCNYCICRELTLLSSGYPRIAV